MGIQITGEEEKIDPAPIPRILGHAHHTVTVRKLGLCTRHGTGRVARLSMLLDEVASLDFKRLLEQIAVEAEQSYVGVRQRAVWSRPPDDHQDALVLNLVNHAILHLQLVTSDALPIPHGDVIDRSKEEREPHHRELLDGR